jgi:hypothetical protein
VGTEHEITCLNEQKLDEICIRLDASPEIPLPHLALQCDMLENTYLARTELLKF